jgi:integrase
MHRTRRDIVTVRAQWRKSDRGCWSLSLGERGCRVRVMQRRPGGTYYRVVWVPARGSSWVSLQTTSRPDAKSLAERFLRALRSGAPAATSRPISLGELWTRYQQEAPAYRRNTARTQADKNARAKLLLLGLDPDTPVKDLTIALVERYTELRHRGTGWPDRQTRPSVRTRSVQADLQLLRTIVRWGTTVKLSSGEWLVTDNPLRGLSLPREASPRRPVATYDRYLAVRAAVQRLAGEAKSERGRCRWIRLEMALVLAEATGRRIGAIAGLRWSNIDFTGGTITWRREFDKSRREQVIPVPEPLITQLHAFRTRLAAVGDTWLFPRVTDDQPWPRELFGQLLRTAELGAGVPKLAGGAWHPFRRKWATERKSLPLADVKEAGGWKDTPTLVTSYQQADEGTLLAVMSSPVKLVGRRLSANS